VQLHFTTRVRYGFLSVQLNYTIRRAKENIRRKLSVIAGFKWYNESDIYL
jgi:hypothetical protein